MERFKNIKYYIKSPIVTAASLRLMYLWEEEKFTIYILKNSQNI